MKQQVNPGIIAAAVVVVLGLIGAMAYMTLWRHSSSAGADTSSEAYKNYMKGIGSGGAPGVGGSSGSGSPNSVRSPGSGG